MTNENHHGAITPWLSQVELLAKDVCRGQGCILYDVQFVGTGAGRTLQVFVDRDGEGGPGIDDCSNVSRGLNALLDEQDVIPGGPYNLEVSTPGVDRILTKPWHFEKVVGKKIRVRSREPMENLGMTDTKWAKTKQVEEVLSGADSEAVTFKVKEGSLRIPYSVIEKAKVVFEMEKKGHPKGGHKK